MENYFATLIEDVRYERSLTLFLSFTDGGLLGQHGFRDHEVNIIKFLD